MARPGSLALPRRPLRNRAGRAVGVAWAGVAILAVAFGVAIALGPSLLVLMLLASVGVGVLVVILRPESFVAATLVFIGTMQIWQKFSVSAGSASLYATDIFVLIVVARGLLRRPRWDGTSLGVYSRLALAVFFGLMAVGVLRGLLAGGNPASVFRISFALVYWPGLYFGYSRIFRERDLDPVRLLRACLAIAIAFAFYMLLMRAINHPFESPTQNGRLGEVVGRSGQVFRRDYGFYSAYMIYPLLALVALGQAFYSRGRDFFWIALACLGVATTMLSLIRAEMYGLAAGIVLLPILSRHRLRGGLVVRAQRLRALGMLAGAFLAVSVTLAVVDPPLAGVIRERSIPRFSHQSSAADANAQYRFHAFTIGLRVAHTHLSGLGFIDATKLSARGVDFSYLVHSAPAWLLTFLGWPGLLAAIVVLMTLFRESARKPSNPEWLHPLFVASFVMMALYGFGAVGLVGQEYVIAGAALLLAARFSLVIPQRR